MHNPDWKILAFAGVAGIAAGIGASWLMGNVDMMNPSKGAGWYVLPAAFLGGGALLLGKMPVIGITLAAIGALIGYEGYSAAASQAPGQGGAKGLGAGWNMRRDSGLFDHARPTAGALGGARAAAMRADQGAGGDNWQGAGAMQGRGANRHRQDQGAGGDGWRGAGGVAGLES